MKIWYAAFIVGFGLAALFFGKMPKADYPVPGPIGLVKPASNVSMMVEEKIPLTESRDSMTLKIIGDDNLYTEKMPKPKRVIKNANAPGRMRCFRAEPGSELRYEIKCPKAYELK